MRHSLRTSRRSFVLALRPWVGGARAVAVAAGLAACAGALDSSPDAGADAGSETAEVTGELPCDVERILSGTCQSCHQNPPMHDAPFPLVTYADTHALRGNRPLYVAMADAIGRDVMPAPPAKWGMQGDRARLLAWASTGAPPRSASVSCSGATSTDGPSGAIEAGAGDVVMLRP